VPELDVGASLGGYRIEAVLGRGGMSVVYRARQLTLDRTVALKVLTSELADDPAFHERFLREGRVVASTDHPNIRPVYDVGEIDGSIFIAMRFVDGPTLQALVNEGPLEPARATAIVRDVASALDAAHERGLIHRDVKPSNVMLERRSGREHVFLTDFGIAKVAAARELTKTGVFVGTIDYIAPEQVTGQGVTPAADIYALGAVLYVAVTGRVPFERDSDVAVLFAHVNDPPPRPSSIVPGLSPALDDVVAKAMAKSPDARYPTAGALGAAAVRAATGADATQARPVTAPTTLDVEPIAKASAPKRRRWSPPFGQTVIHEPPPPSSSPPSPPDAGSVVSFRLRDGFRYVHEPLDAGENGMPFIGNVEVVEALRERIDHSSGGSFLVTGFRGVGKTTVIGRALEELASSDGAHVVPISLNVARPMTTDELLFEVVRRLFEALIDLRVFERLAPEIQRALVLAYTRTSLSFKETRANAFERGRSIDLGLGGVAAPVFGRITPKLSFSKKETRSLATEAAFLAYSDADVEHDFLRIISLVRRADTSPAPARGWRRLLRPATAREPWLGKLIVVIDELDKLTAREDGLATVEQILTGLKNLLTTRGVHFLFVAGPDLHDRALLESHQGNSVYESVFGWQVYVPCMWDAPRRLLDAIVEAGDRDDEWFELFCDYLTFKARGIPRLLLIELNSFVRWREGRPVIVLDRLGVVRVQFYASLQRILDDFLQRPDEGAPFGIAIDEDRWRLGAYYVTDWILRNKSAEFTVDDVAGSEAAFAVDPTLVVSARKVEELIEHLVASGILEQVRGRADQAYMSDAPAAQKPAYAVVRERYEQLARLQRGNERERADLVSSMQASGRNRGQPWDESGAFGSILDGRFELVRELDRGGIASIYHARDRALGRDVAIKLLEDPELRADAAVRARFERQAMIAASLEHPNIVSTYETFALDDGRLGTVMQLIDGVSLRTLLSWAPLPGSEAVRLSAQLLDALEYLAERDIVRIDLKPANILLDPERKPVIVDVGLAKVLEEDVASGNALERRAVTIAGDLVGTPAYLAPEQAVGAAVDARTDIFTIGLLLYEMVAGKPARRGDGIGPVLEQARHAEIDVTGLAISPELRSVIARACARNPEGRFAAPAEMRDALAATPEGAANFVSR
jgi:serine/threonine-protein kinase